MTATLPVWVQYVQALGPAFVAAVAAVVAGVIQWRHWRTARDKLKLDIFEKRYAVYSQLIDLINYTMISTGESRYDLVDVNRFYRIIDEIEFLFGQDISGFALELRSACELCFGAIDIPERMKRDDASGERSRSDWAEGRSKLRNLRTGIEERFQRYFSLAHIA